eukprot:GFUD01006361.1.p1 GENE.GFUD01006361.1~~GFUD01006361.1.p1  ORF type:complete len:337 (+),score=110.42 GFUD01006361.1:1921-2931(+)
MLNWKEEKARILALSVDARRKIYTCGDEFVQLEKISAWSDEVKSAEAESKAAEKETKKPEQVKLTEAESSKSKEVKKSSEENNKPDQGKSAEENNKIVEKVEVVEGKKSSDTNDATTSCDSPTDSKDKTVDTDPEWITQLKKDLDQDIEKYKLNVKLDLSSKVSVFVGDITKLEIDGIVNAANNSLLGGGGVDGAIHRAAGKLLYLENRTHNGCEDGKAKLSGGYHLPAKYVISTVGPQGEYPVVLSSCYSNCLTLLLNNNLKSIAFPCISTGVYGYPNTAACSVALRTVRRWLEEEGNHEKIDRVVFCLFLKKDQDIYKKMLPIVFPVDTQTAKL